MQSLPGWSASECYHVAEQLRTYFSPMGCSVLVCPYASVTIIHPVTKGVLA